MTAITIPQLTIIRDPNQYTELSLAKFEPRILLQAQINDATILKGAKTITFDNVVTGSYTNVVAGQSLYIGSTQGNNDIGRVRIRSITSSQITVAVDDDIDYTDNQYLTVREFFEIWPVFPLSTLNTGTLVPTFYKDWDIAYSDQNENFDPIIIMGPDFAGYYDGSFALTGVYFTATGSYTVDGSTISSYSWNFPAGCSITGSTLGTPGNVVFPAAGMYVVRCAVTASNGKTAIAYRHVMLLNKHYGDDTIQPALNYENISDWEFGDVTTDNINGSLSKITVRNRANEFRDGDLVIIFRQDTYQTNLQSFGGYPGREHILFIGYVDKADSEYDAFISKTDFILKGSAAYLQNKEMFSVQIQDTQSSPSTWNYIKNMTINKGLNHYVRWHSTLLNVKDFKKLVTGEGEYPEDVIQFQKGEILSNLSNFMQQRLLGFISSDRQGTFYTEIDLQILLTGSRPTSVMTFQEGDWLGQTKISELVEQPISDVLMGGVTYNPAITTYITGVPMLSRAPGQYQTYIGKSQNVSGLTLTSQSNLNNIAGLYYAKVNNETPDIQLELSYNMTNIDIYPQEFYNFNISGTINLYRGLNWKPKRIIPRKETIKLDKFVLRQTITFEPETYGPPGDTIVIPVTIPGGTCIDCGTPPPCDCVTNPSCDGCPPPIAEGDGNTVYVATYNKLARTRNFLSASPNYVDLTTITPDGTICDFCVDSYDPVNIGFVLTKNKLYGIFNLNSSSPTWTVLYTLADAVAYAGDGITPVGAATSFQRIISPITLQGLLWIGWAGTDIENAGKVCSGITWALYDVAHHSGMSQSKSVKIIDNTSGFVDVRRIVQNFNNFESVTVASNHQSNGYYMRITHNRFSPTGFNTIETIKWAGPFTHAYDIEEDYPSRNTIELFFQSSDTNALYKVINNVGGVTILLSHTISGAFLTGFSLQNHFINIATGNKNDILIMYPQTPRMYRSIDGGVNWTSGFSLGGGSVALTALGRWPSNPERVFVLGSTILYSTDGAITFSDKIGDWTSVIGTWPTDYNGETCPIMIIPITLAY